VSTNLLIMLFCLGELVRVFCLCRLSLSMGRRLSTLGMDFGLSIHKPRRDVMQRDGVTGMDQRTQFKPATQPTL
jgi:hypothetical protein